MLPDWSCHGLFSYTLCPMSLLSGQADVYPSYLNMYMLEACTEQLLAAALCYKGMLKQGESCAHKIQAEMTL